MDDHDDREKLQQINQAAAVTATSARRMSCGSPGRPTADPRSAESPQFGAESREGSQVSLAAIAPPRARATTLNVPGLTRSKVSPNGSIPARDIGSKLVIIMVGLPARGKSYVTKKLCRYLNWQQHNTKLFNVGNTRRRDNQSVGPAQQPLPDNNKHNADFFSPDNKETSAMREKWAYDTLNELLDYVLEGDGSVGILDATNTTVARRSMVLERIKERSGGQLKALFLESICTRSDIIESNVRLKLSGPDYKDMDQEVAIEDFTRRLKNYEKAYETIGAEEEKDPDFQYVKMINAGQKVECGNIKGFLACRTVFFLLNFNLDHRQIWITRHGESTDNQAGRIGGDAELTERGQKYARTLARFMEHRRREFRKQQLRQFAQHQRVLRQTEPPTPLNEPEDVNFCVWTSMLRRAVQTGEFFDENKFDIKEMRMLNEIDAGVCNEMTYEEIRTRFPDEYKARMEDKMTYRYPGIGGESYLDVINRLRPVIVEIERMSDNCLVVCHRVVARILLAYFMDLGRDAIGDLEVPLHTLYMLEPKPYGVVWELYKYNEDSDWFYRVTKDATAVQNQLSDRQRRYTVLPTADMRLGDTATRSALDTAIESDEDDEEDVLTQAVERL